MHPSKSFSSCLFSIYLNVQIFIHLNSTIMKTLTKKNLEQIKSDQKKVEMLTDAEVNALAQKVNMVINLPILNEEKEFVVFVKIIKWIDQKLYEILPNEYYELINDATDGISKDEAVALEQRLTPIINNAIDIPIISERQEEKLISLVLGIIINAMVKGFKLEETEPEG